MLSVNGSIAESSIEITHDDAVDSITLIGIVRAHVHGTAMFVNEIRMVPLEPATTDRVCDHA